MCARCEDLEDRIAELEAMLGLRQDAIEIERLTSALHLRPGAVHVLMCLYDAKGRIVPKSHIEEAVPSVDHARDRQTDLLVKVYVCNLRKALGAEAIETLWGRGYRLTLAGAAKVSAILQPQKAAA